VGSTPSALQLNADSKGCLWGRLFIQSFEMDKWRAKNRDRAMQTHANNASTLYASLWSPSLTILRQCFLFRLLKYSPIDPSAILLKKTWVSSGGLHPLSCEAITTPSSLELLSVTASTREYSSDTGVLQHATRCYGWKHQGLHVRLYV